MRIRSHRSKYGNVAEFPVALVILLLVFAFPLVDLLGIATGAAVGFLTMRQAASAAATQQTFSANLSAMEKQTRSMLNSGLARFVHLVPAGGYHSCGVDLYVDATKYKQQKTLVYGPNKPVPPPIDASNTIYVCSTRGTFSVGPLIDLSAVPWLGTVPGLGTAAKITLNADRASEYPIGLIGTSSDDSVSLNTMPPKFNSVPTASSANGGVQDSGWRNPDIYTAIAAQGKKVVQETVVIVSANKLDWTDSGVSVTAGEQVWIDTQASGSWEFDMHVTGPDGDTKYNSPHGLPEGALVAQLGHNPMFVLGAQKMNLAPPGAGPLLLCANSNSFNGGGWSTFNDQHQNGGYMTCRVIITN